MNKQNLWFITLFSLILVLSVYYVTMPNDLLLSSAEEDSVAVSIEESNIISVLKITKEEERQALESTYQEALTNAATTDEKNEALENIKSLQENATMEEELEQKIKDTYDLECCVSVNTSVITATCLSSSHDSTLANNIMRLIQGEYDTKQTVTVKFET